MIGFRPGTAILRLSSNDSNSDNGSNDTILSHESITTEEGEGMDIESMATEEGEGMDIESMATEEEGEGMDILSKLPDEMIRHIFSFLTTQEAARTRVVSKAWLNIWRRRPNLDFDCRRMVSPRDAKERKKKFTREALQYIISTLQDRLNNLKIDLQRFSFRFNFSIESGENFDSPSLVDQCIELAVRNGVRNLDLSIDGYALPQIVLEANSLVDLSLGACRLQHQNLVMCCNLKRLFLSGVCLDEVMFENIMINCPLIEILVIRNCWNIEKFMVGNLLKKLKQLKADLHFSQRIEVESPNLELIDCSHFIISGRDPEIINLRAPRYLNLKSLLLSDVVIDDHSFVNFARKFPHVEDLSIEQCDYLQRIKISSPSLKEIKLQRNKGLKEADFDVPNITSFVYADLVEQNWMPSLSFTAASGGRGSGWVSSIEITCYTSRGTSWFLALKGFLKSLNRSEIFLALNFVHEVAFNGGEMINFDAVSEAPQIQELCIIDFWRGIPEWVVHATLDGIFWTCRPRKIWGLMHLGFFESLHEKLMLRKKKDNLDFVSIQFSQGNSVRVNDVNIFDSWKKPYSKYRRGPGLWLPKCLEFLACSAELRGDVEIRRNAICFNLEWNL